MGDGYVDVGFFPRFGREGTPGEGGGWGVGEPAVEGCGWTGFVWGVGEVGCVLMISFDGGGW